MAKGTAVAEKVSEIQDKVIGQVLEALQGGSAPWVKPWTSVGGGLPYNAATGRKYNGSNVLLLWLTAKVEGYPLGGWMTFKQAKELGAQVRKGEKSTAVMFSKLRMVPDVDTNGKPILQPDGEPKLKCIGLTATYFNVFNVAQIDGLPEKIVNPTSALAEMTEIERHAAADAFFAALPGVVKWHGDRAYYSPGEDYIGMPESKQFKDGGAYYATLAHEYVHWTGHKSRLDRFGDDFEEAKAFDAGKYAYEELIAEMGSAFLCAELGIDGFLQHASYLEHWVKEIQDKKQALFSAAAAASKAVAYLQNLVNEAMGIEDMQADEATEAEPVLALAA